MLTKLMRTTVATAAKLSVAGMLCASFAAAPALMDAAHAAKPKIETLEASFTALQRIRVISVDGVSWSRLADGEVDVTGNVTFNTDNESPNILRISLGVCNAIQCVTNPVYPVLYFEDINLWEWGGPGGDFSKDISFQVNPGAFPGADGVPSNNVQAQELIKQCNERFNVSDATGQELNIPTQFNVSVGLQFHNSAHEGDYDPPHDLQFEHFPVLVTVVCEPFGAMATEDISALPTPFKVTTADLELKTFQVSQSSGPQYAGYCEKLKTTAKFKTTKAGNVHFRLYRKIGSEPVAYSSHTVESKQQADGTYLAKYAKFWTFNKTTPVQFMAKSVDGAFAPSTPWKHRVVRCETEISDHLPPSDDTLPPGQKLTGDFSFIDNGGTQCSRQGKALINFKTPDPQPVHFSLDCLHGHFSGVAQTAPHPGGGYVAPALVTFDIHQTTQATCALKSVAPGTPKLHAFKGHLFQCVTRNIDPASGDFTNNPGADPGRPSQPPIVDNMPVGKPNVTGDPVRRVCSGGAVMSTRSQPPQYFCKCDKAGWTAVKAGPVNWRCVDTDKRDAYKIDKAKADARRKALEDAAKARRAKAARDAAEIRRKREAARKAAEAARRKAAATARQKAAAAAVARQKAAAAAVARQRAAAAAAARQKAAAAAAAAAARKRHQSANPPATRRRTR